MTTSKPMHDGLCMLTACNEASRAGALLAAAHHHHLGDWPRRQKPLSWIHPRCEMIRTLMHYCAVKIGHSNIKLQHLVERAFDGALFAETLRGQLEILSLLQKQGDEVSLDGWPEPQKTEIEQNRLENAEAIDFLWRRN